MAERPARQLQNRPDWQQWGAAESLIDSAAAGPPAPHLVWALGVFAGQHVHKIAQVWDGHPLVDPSWGSTTWARRFVDSRPGQFVISDLDAESRRPRPMITVRLADVHQLLAPKRVPAALVDEARALVAERYAHGRTQTVLNDRHMHGQDRPTTAEILAAGNLYGRLERRSSEVAARIWAAVRPTEQLDLFTLAGGTR